MSKHAVMPLTDYVNVCDALREKTGTTDVIKSGDIPKKVNDVYDMGKLATLKDSQYMNGKESGTIVSVNDVTPIEHNVGVKVASKNLFRPNYADYTQNRFYSYVYVGSVNMRMSFTDKDTAVDVNGIQVGFMVDINNVQGGASWAVKSGVIQANNSNVSTSDNSTLCPYIVIYPNTEDAFNRITARYNIQVEIGTTVTEYTPYVASFAEGENIIPYPYVETTKTEDGITFTDNGDGSLTLNGTAGENAYFSLMPTTVLAKGEYTISGNTAAGCDVVVFMYYGGGGVNTIIQSNGIDAKLSLTDDTEINVSIYVDVGATFNDVTIHPKISNDLAGIKVRQCGANLFPFGESVKVQGHYVNGPSNDFLPTQTNVEFLRGKKIRYSAYFDLSGAVEDTTQAGVKTIFYDANGSIIRQDFGNALKKADGVTQGYSAVSPQIPQNTAKLMFCITVYFNGTAKPDPNSFVTVSQGMVKFNTGEIEYEPYTETIYTANADGTVEGVKSISPNMTLIPNNNAVTVECEYLRDIDLYIDNLLKSVAMIGGE